MEALGEAQETVDFFSHYAADFESHAGYEQALPDDRLAGFVSRNRSVMRPYGVWVVIAPFNFPLALAGGPVAAALVTGNTVVVKGASDTPWAGRLLADCVRDAGLPPGVFNYVSGSGREVGEALVAHPATAGITFTGSAAVGMHISAAWRGGAYPRPCIAEMGGKNPCIVTGRPTSIDAAAGHRSLGLWHGLAEVLGASRLTSIETVADGCSTATSDDPKLFGWRPDAARELARPGGQRGCVCEFTRVRAMSCAGGRRRIFTAGRQLHRGRARRGYFVRAGVAEAAATPVEARDVPADPDGATA